MNNYYELDWLWDSGKIFNIGIASRGSGKTFAMTRRLVQNAYLLNRKFVMLVRYQNEIDTFKMSGFGGLNSWIAEKGHTYKFEKTHRLAIGGNDIYLQNIAEDGVKIADDIHIGFIISLNTYQKLKKIDYSEVDWIFQDELLTDDGKYLKDEPIKLMNLMETISRGYREPYRFVRFFGMANATSLLNPYFKFLKIYKLLDPNTSYQRFKTETLAFDMQVIENTDKNESQFGKLIAGTDYAEYSRSNAWLLKESWDIIDKDASYPQDKLSYYIEIPNDVDGFDSIWVGIGHNKKERTDDGLGTIEILYFRTVKKAFITDRIITPKMLKDYLKTKSYVRLVYKDEYVKGLIASEFGIK